MYWWFSRKILPKYVSDNSVYCFLVRMLPVAVTDLNEALVRSVFLALVVQTVEMLPRDKIAIEFFEPEGLYHFLLLPYRYFPNMLRYSQPFFAIQPFIRMPRSHSVTVQPPCVHLLSKKEGYCSC